MTASIEMRVLRRCDLTQLGLTDRQIRTAVAGGAFVRARRDRYVPADAPSAVLAAARVGGRLTCLSLLRLYGVFVQERPALHVHVERGSSRHGSPRAAGRALEPRADRVRRHWRPLVRPEEAATGAVDIVDALAHAVQCQPPRAAIATLDSAMHQGFISPWELDVIFDALPTRYAVLRGHLDARAESGTETLVRLIARSLGCSVELQVRFPGIGRVDLLIDGWLVIECDSVAHHADERGYANDRERDLKLAARGYVTLRVAATTVFDRPEDVRAAIVALRQARAAGFSPSRAAHNSGSTPVVGTRPA